MNTFRVLAALLSYPTEAVSASVNEMRAILREERLLSGAEAAGLDPLLDDLVQLDIYDLQSRYVELFDQSRSLSLHLFEHVHGESLDRGQAMVDLLQRYRQHGLELSAVELPDFVPVFLEYLSQLPVSDAVVELGEMRNVISTLARRLARRVSPYAAVLGALERLANEQSGASAAPEAGPDQQTPETDSPQALDAEWQEQPVDFSKREAGFVSRQRARARSATTQGER